MTNQDIQDVLRSVIGRVDQGDAVAVYSESTPVDFDMDQLKSVEDVNRFSIGLRLFHGGRVGNSFVNSRDDIDFLLKTASDSARLGDPLSIDLPPQTKVPDMNLFCGEVPAYRKEDAIRLGSDVLARVKAVDERAKASVSVSRHRSSFHLANTNGFSRWYEETRFGVSAGLILVEDEGGLLFVGDGDQSRDLTLDLDRVFRNIEWRYRHAGKKSPVKSGYWPVIFAPESQYLFTESLELAANGKSLYKGVSVLADKTGERIAHESFSMEDDPLLPGGLGSYPFDDEGVPPARLPVVERGVFRNFIFDLTYGSRTGHASTGHAGRGVSSLPAPSFSNTVIAADPAGPSLDDMIASVDYGLIVFEFLGGGMSNLLAGDFSVNIELGYLIEKGKVAGRVKNAMIAGNVYDLLKNIRAVENRVHKKGGFYAPHILFDKVSVAG